MSQDEMFDDGIPTTKFPRRPPTVDETHADEIHQPTRRVRRTTDTGQADSVSAPTEEQPVTVESGIPPALQQQTSPSALQQTPAEAVTESASPAETELPTLEREYESDPALLQEFPWLSEELPKEHPDENALAEVPGLAVVDAQPEVVAECAVCSGGVGPDGYCYTCGARKTTERDHFEEQPSTWVAGVCDRGRHHLKNEDALATASEEFPDGKAVLVVCDGVTASTGSDVASLAAAQIVRDLLLQPSGNQPVAERLRQSAHAAHEQVLAHTPPGSDNPPSCTFTVALVTGGHVHIANIGDSRAYWLPDSGQPQLLSVDHSLAAEEIARGVPREIAETQAGAHTLTRWLGLDAPSLDPDLTEIHTSTPGWLLVCSDGLWNYASEARALASIVQTKVTPGITPLALATNLVDWANERGGRDNIAVALARLNDPRLANASF